MTTNTNNKIGFSLNNITTEQFAIIDSSYTEGVDIDLKAGLKFGINREKKIISVIFSTSLLQEKTPFIIIEVGCNFKIKEEAWDQFLNESKTELIVPKGFVRHLATISVGTTRGVLHSKTENTPFNKFFLPTINVMDLVKKDAQFNLEKIEMKR